MTDLPSAYARAGVDIDAATDAVGRMKAHIRTTLTPGVLTDVGSFGGMFALSALGPLRDPVLVSSIDGVGTKLKIAFATGRHDTIGRDLVSHCVNDILVGGARPLFFLDYFGTGKLSPSVAADVVKGLADGCRDAGCALIGGETAEMPGLYADGEYDLAGCIVGLVERDAIVDGAHVRPGDVVLGLASDGLHTNGYSLARKVLLEDAGFDLSDPLPELGGMTLADALLAPHRCYLRSVGPLLGQAPKEPPPAPQGWEQTAPPAPQIWGEDALQPVSVSQDLAGSVRSTASVGELPPPRIGGPGGPSLIHAMAHITGGGFVDNIPRVLPAGVGVQIVQTAWDVPPLFRLIQAKGGVTEAEMFRVFNMGIGYVLIVDAGAADDILARLTASGERAYKLGEAVAGAGVTFTG